MDKAYLKYLLGFYRRELFENIVPFWQKHVVDKECGGYHTCLNRDGSVYEYDKVCMWAPGRVAWTFSHLYNNHEKKAEWLATARVGVDFLRKHGFAPDGSMYYALTREGRPLAPAQDVFTELSTVLGYTEFARATGDEALYGEARELFRRVWARLQEPGRAFQPAMAETRPARLHGHSMITLNVIQELRRFRQEPDDDIMVEQCIEIMLTLHARKDRKAVMELVGWDGSDLPGHQGRWINPGHMLEGGTFLIHEGQRREKVEWIQAGVEWISWGFNWGWDKMFGGIYNDVDLRRFPVPLVGKEPFHSMKLWWQHAEALYALLLAYSVTREERFMEAYRQTHRYCDLRFADAQQGEWYGMLDRRGNALSRAKGSDRKNIFHIGRNFFLCIGALKELLAKD